MVREFESHPLRQYNMGLKYNELQPWVDMLCDALENKGASSSGLPNPEVYVYAQLHRDLLAQVRSKQISKYYLEQTLRQYEREIEIVSNQPHRTKKLCEALKIYFLKEFMT